MGNGASGYDGQINVRNRSKAMVSVKIVHTKRNRDGTPSESESLTSTTNAVSTVEEQEGDTQLVVPDTDCSFPLPDPVNWERDYPLNDVLADRIVYVTFPDNTTQKYYSEHLNCGSTKMDIFVTPENTLVDSAQFRENDQMDVQNEIQAQLMTRMRAANPNFDPQNPNEEDLMKAFTDVMNDHNANPVDLYSTGRSKRSHTDNGTDNERSE
jgi:hypothetical protein